MNTTTAIESCPPTVRSSRVAARAKHPTLCRLSDDEIAQLIGEIVTLETAAQRRTEARPS